MPAETSRQDELPALRLDGRPDWPARRAARGGALPARRRAQADHAQDDEWPSQELEPLVVRRALLTDQRSSPCGDSARAARRRHRRGRASRAAPGIPMRTRPLVVRSAAEGQRSSRRAAPARTRIVRPPGGAARLAAQAARARAGNARPFTRSEPACTYHRHQSAVLAVHACRTPWCLAVRCLLPFADRALRLLRGRRLAANRTAHAALAHAA